MTRTAEDVLNTFITELAPDADENQLVPRIADGSAGRDTLAALVLEQHQVVASDHRAFVHLAERAAALGEPAGAEFFAGLAEGEEIAAGLLHPLADACGLDEGAVAAYEPMAGCQAYPSYVARLALTGEPPGVALTLTANFSEWGGYCATLARGLRDHYRFPDEACAFFDFFAAPESKVRQQATAAVQAGLDDGRLDLTLAMRQGRLLQTYESQFWQTLADLE